MLQKNERKPSKGRMGFKWLALCTAAASLLVFSACNSESINRDMDVVATVDGTPIYRWELDRQFDRSRQEYESTASAWEGEEVNLDSPQFSEERFELRKTLVNMLVDDVIATEAAKKLYPMTAEEEAAVEAQYDTFVEDNIQNIMDTQFAGDADGRKKAEEMWAKNLQDNHMTPESLKQNMYNTAVREKLSADLHAEVAVSEEELRATYDQSVAEDKEEYEKDPVAYSELYATRATIPNTGSVFYNPPGFRRVKQIMISIPADIDQKIRENNQREGEIILEQDAIAREKGQDDPAVAELEEQKSTLHQEAAALFEEGYGAIEAKAQEVYAKVQAGEDFDKLIEEYGDDPGMTQPPISQVGYLVGEQSSQLLPQFVSNAMLLENVGDTSELFTSTEGYHILKLVENIEEGPVSFEDVEERMRDLAEAQPRQNVIDEFVNEHREEFTVVINDSNI